MKKLVTIALLCAMLLSCFVGCGSMQAGELDVDAYAAEVGAQNVEFRTELDDEYVDIWDGSADKTWYTEDPGKTEYHISTAAELRGLYEIQQACANDTSCFEGVTIYLENDIDLAGKKWSSASSTKYFAGTFDGQGHVIANWYQEVTGSGYQSFFGSVTGNACIKNVSLVNGTFHNKLNKANKDTFSVVATRATTVSGKKIIISNVYTDVDYVTQEGVAYTLSKAGALVGHVQGDGDLLVENCQNNNSVAINGSRVAGVISLVDSAKAVTVKNCSVTGSLSSASSGNGGIIGYVQTMTGSLLVENCTVSADVSGKGQTAGIIGVTNVTKAITIKNCEVTGDITGTTQTAGVLGQLAANRTSSGKTIKGSASGVVVEGCYVSGAVTGTTMSGGILGYSDNKVGSLKISDCTFAGSLTAQRTSGGIMGTLNVLTDKAWIDGCEVTGELNFTLNDEKNHNVGGMFGKVHSTTYIDNCYVDADMTVTFAPKNAGSSSNDLVSGAAGLIGRVLGTNITVHIANTSVDGNFTFINEGNDFGLTFNTGRLVGSVDASAEDATAEVIYRENVTIAPTLTMNYDNCVSYATDIEGTLPAIMPVGYQTRANADDTYDLRFVFAIADATAFSGAGVDADLRFVDEDGIFDEKKATVFAEYVYKNIYDEAGNSYIAASYGYEYLYTLVVTGVPAGFNFADGTLQAVLTPFGADEFDGEVYKQNGVIKTVGAELRNTSATGGITIDDMSAELDEKFADALYIDGHDFDTDLSYGVHTGVKASAAECDGEYADGTLPIPAHVYLDSQICTGSNALMNITYTFEIEEAGYYDMALYLRMKGAGTTGDGSYDRGYLMVIDDACAEEVYDLHMTFENVTEIKDASAGTYLNGIQVYLEEGTHTISFTTGSTGSYPHIRGIYLALAE